MERIKNIHFIAGLPRSGSTALSAILRQNPNVHAAMSSPVEHIFASALASMSYRNHFHRFITERQRKDILRGILDAYYAQTNHQWIFDTNRNWPTRLTALLDLFPEAKVVCCVRDLVSVVNSFEHLVQKSPFSISKLFNSNAYLNVYGRYDLLMHPNGSVGQALQALKEGYYGMHADRLILVEYDDLIAKPLETIRSLYQKLDIDIYEHDFNNIEYQEPEFDRNLSLTGMHTVRKSVGREEKKIILPQDIVQKLQGAEFWRKPKQA